MPPPISLSETGILESFFGGKIIKYHTQEAYNYYKNKRIIF